MTKLEEYRESALLLYEQLGEAKPLSFTCDACGVREHCRFAYAPACVDDLCVAETLGVRGKSEHVPSSLRGF